MLFLKSSFIRSAVLALKGLAQASRRGTLLAEG